MPEKGKDKGHTGHDGRVGGRSFGGEHLSHEPRAPKKTKSQMCTEQKKLKWMQTDEFHKVVAFVEIRTNVGLPYAHTFPEGIS